MVLNCRAQSKQVKAVTSENSNSASTDTGASNFALATGTAAGFAADEVPEIAFGGVACIYSMPNVSTRKSNYLQCKAKKYVTRGEADVAPVA
jgi:hypothetical protein